MIGVIAAFVFGALFGVLVFAILGADKGGKK